MGVSIDLMTAPAKPLIIATMEYCGYDLKDQTKLQLITDIFDRFCINIDNTYVVLNNEYFEDHNPFFNMIHIFDTLSGKEDWQCEVFYKNSVRDHKVYHDADDVLEEFGIVESTEEWEANK